MATPSSSGGNGVAEDDESSSSSSSPLAGTPNDALNSISNDFRTALDEFRDNWQRELKRTDPSQLTVQNAGSASQFDDIDFDSCDRKLFANDTENQALAESLFRKAVELEQCGKVYDALPFYRKAVQIVPDIEFILHESEKTVIAKVADQKGAKQLNNNVAHHINDSSSNTINDTEYQFIEDLYEKFQIDLAQDYGGKLFMNSRDAGVITTELHISDLPPEILLYILRWVVSAHLDMRSLEQCALVCKGMYLCTRDEDIWKLACLKVWGANLGTLGHSIIGSNCTNITPNDNTTSIVYTTWRQMFIERERVLFNGCYISKTTYLRLGENSFQDQYYRPVQLVEYFRYVRFLPDGTVLMMTNADEPAQGVTKLKYLQQIRSDVLRGHYHLNGNTVTVVLKKHQRNVNAQPYIARPRRGIAIGHDELAYTTYCIDFRIMNTPKRRFCQLVWERYSLIQTRNMIEISSDFDLTPSKYPPLWFSPVRSYHLDADAPLG